MNPIISAKFKSKKQNHVYSLIPFYTECICLIKNITTNILYSYTYTGVCTNPNYVFQESILLNKPNSQKLGLKIVNDSTNT